MGRVGMQYFNLTYQNNLINILEVVNTQYRVLSILNICILVFMPIIRSLIISMEQKYTPDARLFHIRYSLFLVFLKWYFEPELLIYPRSQVEILV